MLLILGNRFRLPNVSQHYSLIMTLIPGLRVNHCSFLFKVSKGNRRFHREQRESPVWCSKRDSWQWGFVLESECTGLLKLSLTPDCLLNNRGKALLI